MTNLQYSFQKLKNAVCKVTRNDFARESFLDWCQDMADTDWTYLGVSNTDWMENLLNNGLQYVVRYLDLYRQDWEEAAYIDGYLPDTKGADIRNWSQELTNYFD